MSSVKAVQNDEAIAYELSLPCYLLSQKGVLAPYNLTFTSNELRILSPESRNVKNTTSLAGLVARPLLKQQMLSPCLPNEVDLTGSKTKESSLQDEEQKVDV